MKNIYLIILSIFLIKSNVVFAAESTPPGEGDTAPSATRPVSWHEAEGAPADPDEEELDRIFREHEASLERFKADTEASCARMDEMGEELKAIRAKSKKQDKEMKKTFTRGMAIAEACTKISEVRESEPEAVEAYMGLKSKQRDQVAIIWYGLGFPALERALELNEERKRRGISVEDIIAENKEDEE